MLKSDIVDIIYFILVSCLSTWLYYDRLSRKRGRYVRRKNICTAVCIFASHMLLLLPVSTLVQSIVYVGQIVIEFYIVILALEGTFVNKLITYIEVNLAIGIGMLAGYLWTGGVENYVEKIIFYSVTLAVAGMAYYGLSFISRHKGKTDNMKGVGMSVMVCMAILLMLYTVGMLLVYLDGDILIWFIYPLFAIASVMVIILISMNRRMTLCLERLCRMNETA